jgi:hypothetical protein
MAVPVARVHLAMEHAALPPLLPAPPNCKMLPLLPTPPCVATIILPKPHANEPSRADSDERWDAHKTRPASAESTASSRPRSFSCGAAAGRRSTYRMNATSPPRPGLAADSAERDGTRTRRRRRLQLLRRQARLPSKAARARSAAAARRPRNAGTRTRRRRVQLHRRRRRRRRRHHARLPSKAAHAQ